MSEMTYVYRRYFSSFVDFAYRELNPGEVMQDSWHIRMMANLLECSWMDGEGDPIRRQVFNLPSAYLKTHVCSVSFPAWVLGRNPKESVLIVAETPAAADDIVEQCARLMSAPRYRSIFKKMKFRLTGRGLETTYGGCIRRAAFGQSLPHRKSDLVIFDNPQSLHSIDRFNPETFRELGNSLKDPKRGVMVVATRRLGPTDLSAFLRHQPRWATIPMPVVGLRQVDWPVYPEEWHTQMVGELLYPWLDDWESIEGHLSELGGIAFCYQYLQGLFLPQTTGQRPCADINGYPATMVGTFDPTWAVSEYLAELKEKYHSHLSV